MIRNGLNRRIPEGRFISFFLQMVAGPIVSNLCISSQSVLSRIRSSCVSLIPSMLIQMISESISIGNVPLVVTQTTEVIGKEMPVPCEKF